MVELKQKLKKTVKLLNKARCFGKGLPYVPEDEDYEAYLLHFVGEVMVNRKHQRVATGEQMFSPLLMLAKA